MKLRALAAEFIGGWHSKDETHEYAGYHRLESIAGAQGLLFQCPKCAEGKPPGEPDGIGFAGAHYVICWFRNPRGASQVPDDIDPKPGRWWIEGTSLDDLTFTHGEPPMAKSVQLIGGCNWHGFVANGEAA